MGGETQQQSFGSWKAGGPAITSLAYNWQQEMSRCDLV